MTTPTTLLQILPPVDLDRLQAYVRGLEADAKLGRLLAKNFLPVMEAMRPLVLNLERLKDAAISATANKNPPTQPTNEKETP